MTTGGEAGKFDQNLNIELADSVFLWNLTNRSWN